VNIHTQESVSGFIATEPRLTYTDGGSAKMYLRFGQNHFRKEDDGTFTELEPTFHNLVAWLGTAERANARLAKGDRFLAEGFTRTYDGTDPDGNAVKIEEFVAKKIGHDLARTDYEVMRGRRTPAADRAFEAPATSQAVRPSVPAL
jgi:single-stranded DNA-binding protein